MNESISRDVALEMLRDGPRGIYEWNRQRRRLVDVPGLSRESFAGTTLCEVDFHRMDLRSVDFTEASLEGANFYGARLDDAVMCRASLLDARFVDTNLTGTDLSVSNLTGAKFQRAILKGTDLDMAFTDGTSFLATDLSQIRNLETIRHRGPSSIDTHTLAYSGGAIPEVFLRGCGLHEDIITYIPSLFGGTLDFYSCFISYSHTDKQFARQIHDRLQGFGIRCWLDEHQMKPGDNIYAGVDQGIRLWDKVLLCCSEASLDSWWVGREIDTAIEREQQFQKEHGQEILKIIPLNLDGSLFTWKGEHAATLRKRLAADFTNWKRNADKFEREFNNVVKALRTDDGPPPPEPKLGV